MLFQTFSCTNLCEEPNSQWASLVRLAGLNEVFAIPTPIRYNLVTMWMRQHARRAALHYLLPLVIYVAWVYVSVTLIWMLKTSQVNKFPRIYVLGLMGSDTLGILLMYLVVRPLCSALLRRGWKWGRMLAVHALVLPVFVYLQALIYALLITKLDMAFGYKVEPIKVAIATALKSDWSFDLIFYAIIVIGTFALHNQRRLREKERLAGELQNQLTNAQLQSLRAQLQPHFLFNVLNAIASYIYAHPDTAVRMVARLSDLLRSSLDCEHKPFISLAQELEIVHNYLEIERLRFSDRLRVAIDVPDNVRQALVPAFLLQPLVENAMRHGIAPQIAGGMVEIAARRQDAQLVIEVRDDGAGATTDWHTSTGIGLRNTQTRLERLFGGTGHFAAGNQAESGFVVKIALPWQTSADPAPSATVGA